jgi:glycosyl transferase family 25
VCKADDSKGVAIVKLKVVVLSLDTAAERRREFSAHVPSDSLPWSFFDAHRALDTRLHYDPRGARLVKGRELQPGEIGCYSSHYAIWAQLLDDDCDAYVVLEDDVVVDWRFLAALETEPLAEQSIHYLRLYYKQPSRFILRRNSFVRRSTRLIELLDTAYGTQGYLIDKVAAEQFLKSFRRVVNTIDDQLDRHWEHGIPNLSVFPFPLFERTVPSEIGESRFGKAKRRWDRVWIDRFRKRIGVWKRRQARFP